MIEVPAAALRAGLLARRLDFVSIGTNDLTQYTTAAERGNAAVSGLADGLEPAVLQLIAGVCADVPEHVLVAVCGDLASNEHAAPLLLGLGVRELSTVAPAVPSVKAAVRSTSLAAAQQLAGRAVAAASADEVRELLSSL
jgi:phosphocarrier protein FPr